MHHAKQPSYQFGETDQAAERLALLAAVFAPSTRDFLRGLDPPSPRDVLDLGCGPGYTTRLLAEVFPRAKVHGADSSVHFIDLARREPHQRIAYSVVDAARHLPDGPHDLIYCRYLLTHLADPEAALALWSDHLRSQGRIAIEENEWIQTTQPAFARYLEIIESMLADAGQRLYVGRDLARVSSRPGLVTRSSDLLPIAASDRDAASMFVLNLATWRRRPFITANYTAGEIEKLDERLRELAHADLRTSSITFGRRRLVLQRAAS